MFSPYKKNAALEGGTPLLLVLLLLVFALLIGNATGSLAGRLTGSLAFAAAAVLCALGQIPCLDCFDTFHNIKASVRFVYLLIRCRISNFSILVHAEYYTMSWKKVKKPPDICVLFFVKNQFRDVGS